MLERCSEIIFKNSENPEQLVDIVLMKTYDPTSNSFKLTLPQSCMALFCPSADRDVNQCCQLSFALLR